MRRRKIDGKQKNVRESNNDSTRYRQDIKQSGGFVGSQDAAGIKGNCKSEFQRLKGGLSQNVDLKPDSNHSCTINPLTTTSASKFIKY